MKNKLRNALNSRGYSFSFDAFLAVVVFVGVLAFVGVSDITSAPYSSQELAKKMLADDMVDVAADLNYLQSFDTNTIQNFFSSVMPGSYDYQMQLNRYRNSGTTFILIDSNTYGNTAQDLNLVPYVETKKVFLTFDRNSPPNILVYSSAKMRVWVKQQ